MDQKCQQFKSFIPTTPERITTPGAKEDHGWYWKCAMIKINALKGKKLDIFKAVSLKTELGSKGVEDCFKDYGEIEEDDWESFYNIYVCLHKFKKSTEDITNIMMECKQKFNMSKFKNIRSMDGLKAMSEEDKAEFGCVSKCYYEKVGGYKEGQYDISKFVGSLPNAVIEVLYERMKNCQEETNEKFSIDERYSCRYFFEFDMCIDM